MITFDDIQFAFTGRPVPLDRETGFLIGVYPGQGIGPEVITVALDILRTTARGTRHKFTILFPDDTVVGQPEPGQTENGDVIAFCDTIFSRGGSVLAGPIGGRGVYNLRSHFDLFCKITPLCPAGALRDAGVIRTEVLEGVDILVVRENSGGVYMGRWSETTVGDDLVGAHSFHYSKAQVLRILRVAFKLASRRRRRLTLVLKQGGLPSISRVWITALEELAPERNHVTVEILEVDNAAFQLIQTPRRFDVVVTGNLFGDILSDCGGLLLGSRGMCFSGNFGTGGKAIFQTGHGAAHDIAGFDTANPVAQVHSLTMMLRTRFGLYALAGRIETGIQQVLAEGWRTPDIAAPGSKVVGTRELGRRIASKVEQLDS